MILYLLIHFILFYIFLEFYIYVFIIGFLMITSIYVCIGLVVCCSNCWPAIHILSSILFPSNWLSGRRRFKNWIRPDIFSLQTETEIICVYKFVIWAGWFLNLACKGTRFIRVFPKWKLLENWRRLLPRSLGIRNCEFRIQIVGQILVLLQMKSSLLVNIKSVFIE